MKEPDSKVGETSLNEDGDEDNSHSDASYESSVRQMKASVYTERSLSVCVIFYFQSSMRISIASGAPVAIIIRKD
jgi:hypothetical protein